MPKRLWPVFLGPPLLLVAAISASGLQLAARAGAPVVLRAIASCVLPNGAGAALDGRPGSWWKTVDRLDANGLITGHRLFVGAGHTASATLDLPVESSVSGPVGGVAVVVADDGIASSVRLVSAAAGCGMTINSTGSVVRSAILNPHDGSVLAHLLERDTRADLGTWRISPPASGNAGSSGSPGTWEARLVAPPIGALAREIGTVWATALQLDAAGANLAVQSCTDLGCLTRVFDLADPEAGALVVRGADQGPLLGFAGRELITWAACPGYPCAIHAWDPATGKSRLLVDRASGAALTRDGRRLVAIVQDARSGHGVAVDPASGRSTLLRGLAAGQRPLGSGLAASTGLEVAADEIVLGSADTDPQAFRPDTFAEEALP
jgi:hypothetical protein